MKFTFLSLVALFGFSLTPLVQAEEAAVAAEREAKFQQAMTGVTLTGRWVPIKDGALGAEKPEKYNIVSVAKTSGENWVINARMKYQQQEIVAPIPVQVKWAGDTAVIIVKDLAVPGGGTYSARVLIHESTYAGTWSGSGYGGLLSGLITKAAAANP